MTLLTDRQLESSFSVSVVMPTYNGAKYIRDQLMSIINQTYRPDEIIISDDGSTDNTIEVVREIAIYAEQFGVRFVILEDNPTHGWSENYEWASKHATGDIVFNSDQDDIWMENKIERVLKVFSDYPDAVCVAHSCISFTNREELVLIRDSTAEEDTGASTEYVECFNNKQGLYRSISSPVIGALQMCIKNKVLKNAIPFPKYTSADKWELFYCCCYGKVYYVHECLLAHRLHDNNVTQADKRMSFAKRITRTKNRIHNAKFSVAPYYDGKAMIEHIISAGYTQTSREYQEALQVKQLGEKKIEIAKSGRIFGAAKLIRLYGENLRYRFCGFNCFFCDLVGIITQKIRM